MTPKEAEAIAKVIRRNHGETAIDFALSQVSYFRTRPNGASAELAWRMVCRALGADIDDNAGTGTHRPKRADQVSSMS